MRYSGQSKVSSSSGHLLWSNVSKYKGLLCIMLDEDELAAEQHVWRRRPSSNDDKGKEEMYGDDDARSAATVFRTPLAPISKPRSVATLIEEDDDDDYRRAPPRRNGQRDDPIVRGARPVPWRVQEAGALVVSYREAGLSARTLDDITLHLLQHPHEFYGKDPPVVLWASVDTGTARIYCKDVVPISLHLLALAFGATFQLQVTAKVRTGAQGWGEAVQVRACRTDTPTPGRYQPLGTVAAVQAALERADLDLRNVESRTQRYMDALGTLDTRDVCDPDWLEQHTKELRAACLADKDDQQDGGGIKAKLARMAGNRNQQQQGE